MPAHWEVFMPNTSPKHFATRPRWGLPAEIAAALLLKLMLLWGLWHFAIQPGKPLVKPDRADVFRPAPGSVSTPSTQENRHVR